MTPLRRRLIEDMTVRNLAPTTQATYLYQVSMFARHFGRSPEKLGPEQIRSYLVYLAMEKELAKLLGADGMSELLAGGGQSGSVAAAQAGCPILPALASLGIPERHEQGVIV